MKQFVRLAVLIACFAAPAQAAPDKRESAIEALARQHPRSAIAAAVIIDGKVSFTAVSGQQSPGKPATRDTLFNIASLTKPITAELIVRLSAESAIDLDEPMSQYWIDPDIADDPRHQRITPRLALSHQTGFPNWRPQNERLRFVRDPGTAFGYSGEGYEYLARYAEKRLGTDFETLVQDRVFAPMGLRNIAHSWRPWMEGRVAVPANGNNFPGSAGPGGIGRWSAADDVYTTIGDYAAFVSAVSRGDGLSPALAAERLRGQVDTQGCPKPVEGCPVKTAMALGWMMLTFREGRVATHEGGDPGVSTVAYFSPDSRDGAVVFISGEGGEPLILQVLEIIDPKSLILRGYKAARAGS